MQKLQDHHNYQKVVKIIAETGIDMITDVIFCTALQEKDVLKRERNLGNSN